MPEWSLAESRQQSGEGGLPCLFSYLYYIPFGFCFKLLQIFFGRAFQHLSFGVKSGTVARTIPFLRCLIPYNVAMRMRAIGR